MRAKSTLKISLTLGFVFASIGTMILHPRSIRRRLGASLAKNAHAAAPAQAKQAFLPLIRKPPVFVPTIHVPTFSGGFDPTEASIFWFGEVTAFSNYADVRVGRDAQSLYVQASVFDRQLWYDFAPSPNQLNSWDAVTLYLDLQGNSGQAPGTSSFQFLGQLNQSQPRDAWQAANHWNGSSWQDAGLDFQTTTGWRGSGINTGVNATGWWIAFEIPFASLGLASPPADSTEWGVGIVLHDRDDAAGQQTEITRWPGSMDPDRPITWAALSFGLPQYNAPAASSSEQIIIRHNLNGAQVKDGTVGGHTNCGGGLDRWEEWGEQNYAGTHGFNIQNQWDVADFPCFSKYYVTFPLNSIPPGKVILSADLTLYQFGNAGQGYEPAPQPSLIQVLSVRQGWSEGALDWNSAPPPIENLSRAWVNPFPENFNFSWPGVARTWDVSQAVANAYARKEPMRLVLYSADAPNNSGKYFSSSDTGEWNAEGRPTLTVTFGNP